MSLLKLDLERIKQKIKKDINSEREVINKVNQAVIKLNNKDNQLKEIFETLTPLNLMTKVRALKKYAEEYASILKEIQDRLGDHTEEVKITKAVTEWQTIAKILGDEKELAKLNQEKFVEQLKSDFKAMQEEVKKLREHLQKHVGDVYEAWKTAVNS